MAPVGGALSSPRTATLRIEEDEPVSRVVHGGPLTRDTTWSGNVLITGWVGVPEGITLTIEPGTIVLFQAHRDYRDPIHRLAIEVRGGTHLAVRTAEARVWFTSAEGER
jgi:hypothetical protein